MAISPIQDIIADIKAGKMVVLMDAEDRENEGDLVMAAEHVTPEAINFMAKHGRGLICLTLSEERCKLLNLPMMTGNNGTSFGTNFTVSIEAAEGVTTGISAADRAHTIKTAVARLAKASDLVQPGHVFPLKAQNGGVLVRAGHTEAGCDLAMLAGAEPAGVICEIMNDDGTMARLSELLKFAEEHGLKIGTIADLIQYRSRTESLVEKVHSWTLPNALETIEEEGCGVVVLLYRDETGADLAQRALGQEAPRQKWDSKTFGIGAQMLKALGVGKMRLMSSPVSLPSMTGFELEVTSFCQPHHFHVDGEGGPGVA
ncbi:3,4-dihydroxy-2-butanone-4-phosphate synthase (plasmid) [Chromobacterium amazonense]|uniref:3,4-dihydroxy-2-butanone-4-phosphate synthase n=1 Tax=Chromobacterium amazonense TaxID=1382803 RepID=UPI00237E68C6|nr:3,4-dihydroxy-2-butanone-4-phosphate synthase [Chromobacterium amazonense]MDE1711898.1 3,4-dihydroxy-2-butanone-4-phosphate synthase [Chromobacterium amazonense]